MATAQNVGEIACIALRTVIDEDFVCTDIYATGMVVVDGNGLAQELVSLFRTITTETFGTRLLLNRTVKGFYDSGGKRTGDIADAQTDETDIGMILLEIGHTMGNICKKIIGLQMKEILVQCQHE